MADNIQRRGKVNNKVTLQHWINFVWMLFDAISEAGMKVAHCLKC